MKTHACIFKTWLPIFPGFYETQFAPSDYDREDWIATRLAEHAYRADEHIYDTDDAVYALAGALRNANILWRADDYDYDGYCEAVCKQAVAAISEDLARIPGGLSLVYEKICSPREYNSRNDTVNVELHVKDVRAFQAWLLRNLFRGTGGALYAAWLRERYTGGDGYLPLQSKDAADWLDVVKTADFNGHYGGDLLEYVMRYSLGGTTIATSEAFYYAVDVDTCGFCKLRLCDESVAALRELQPWLLRGDHEALEYAKLGKPGTTIGKQLAAWKQAKYDAIADILVEDREKRH